MTFPTFCHISEYGDDGYADLHRMLAISQPLNLWAPSSVGILGPRSQVTAERFVQYVEDGLIRVHGREEWLTDRSLREKHPFHGARWNAVIDDPLKSMCTDDRNAPSEFQRVVAAPPADGWRKADDLLAKYPDQTERWSKIFRSRRAKHQLPIGIIETAEREARSASAKAEIPRLVARAILRDAFNHSEAFRQSGAQVPFLLGSADRRFLELVRTTELQLTNAEVPAKALTDDPTLTELTDQLLEVLRHLDVRRGQHDLDGFVRGDGHRELVEWLNTICERLKRTDARTIDREIITELRAQLRTAKLSSPMREFLGHKLSLGVAGTGATGIACSAVDLILSPVSPLAVASFTASVFTLAHGLTKQFQYVPTGFDGPQWPFLYTYRASATRRRLSNLRYILNQF